MHGYGHIKKKKTQKIENICKHVDRWKTSNLLNWEYAQAEATKEMKVPPCLMLTYKQHWILENNEPMASHLVRKLISTLSTTFIQNVWQNKTLFVCTRTQNI